MSFGREVRFRRKLVLSVSVATFLAGWAVAPMKAEARLQQRLDIADDGTVYQYICSDGQPLGTVTDRLTNVSMAIALNSPASVTPTVSIGTTLVARVPAFPLVGTGVANKSNTLITVPSCPPGPDPLISSTGGGTWSAGGFTTSGFGGANQVSITSSVAIPAAQENTNTASCGSNVFGFGTAMPTCTTAQNGPQPSDGFTLGANEGILFIYDGNSFISGAGTLSVAGGGAGFGADSSNNAVAATAEVDTLALNVTTQDTTPPTIGPLSNLTVAATSPAGAVVTFVVTATDVVDPAPIVSANPPSGSTFPVGTTTVIVTATDFSGNTSSASFTVTVMGPSQITSNLTTTAASLNFKQGTNLLQNALGQINSGKTGAACNQLSAFINQTQAQSGKQLTAAEASQLIASAVQIKGALGCP